MHTITSKYLNYYVYRLLAVELGWGFHSAHARSLSVIDRCGETTVSTVDSVLMKIFIT